jgi:hypothetical protein
MIVARVVDDIIEQVAELGDIFPNISFPASGAPEEFLIENSCYVVNFWRSYDSSTQRLVSVIPYIEDGVVYAVEVVDKSEEELSAEEQIKLQKLQKNIIDSTQARLDSFAQTRYYDGILSACTYATDPDPKFSTEGQRAVELRSSTWNTLYEILDEVQNGTRPIPSGYEEIEPELPPLTWE